MFTKLALLIAGLFAATVCMTGCGPDHQSAAQADAAKVQSLNGTWVADGFEAVISDNAITVNIVAPDSKSLYWKGTFPTDSTQVISTADRAALDESLLGSQDSSKTFVVKDDQIDFDITIAGTTRTVHLTK